MSKRRLNIILFLLFLLEGTVFRYLSPDYYGSNITFVPRFVLALIILISIFKDKQYALLLGAVFGLLYDLVYGNVLGLYMVGMAGIGYFSGWLIQFFHPTFPLFLVFEFLSLLVFEVFIYAMLYLYRLANISFDWMIIYVLIPSIIYNLLFAVLMYLPTQLMIEKDE